MLDVNWSTADTRELKCARDDSTKKHCDGVPEAAPCGSKEFRKRYPSSLPNAAPFSRDLLAFHAFDFQQQRWNCGACATAHRFLPVDPSPAPRSPATDENRDLCCCRERGSSGCGLSAPRRPPSRSTAMCACPKSKHTPMSVKRPACSNSISASGVESSFGMFSTSSGHAQRLGEGMQMLQRHHGRFRSCADRLPLY